MLCPVGAVESFSTTKMKYFLLAYFILLVSKTSESSNILVIITTPLQSHMNLFNAVVDNLASNHNITYYSFLKPGRNHPNITEKSIDLYNSIIDTRLKYFGALHDKEPVDQFMVHLKFVSAQYHHTIFQSDNMQILLRSKMHFDLLIIFNLLTEPFFKFAEKFNMPVIQLCTSISVPWTNYAVANPNRLSTDKTFVTPELSDYFIDRLTKFLNQVKAYIYYSWIFIPRMNEIADEYFPNSTSTVQELVQNTDLVFTNTISAMGFSQANVPNVIEIGGLHCNPAKPLPTDLEEFVQGAGEHGVIYFSLGATISDSHIQNSFMKSVLNVFRKLKQRVLWKWTANRIENVPSNVRILKWLPQQDILGHNQTKLFITQGGMLSMQEAAYHGVQVLVIPIINDQFTNAFVAEKRGYGLYQKLNDFSEKRFHNQIIELIQNPSYKENIKNLAKIIKDQYQKPADRVKWWVDYVVRRKNTRLLKPMTENLSLIQAMEIDIYATIFIACIFLCILVIFIFYFALKCVFKMYKTYFSQKVKIS